MKHELFHSKYLRITIIHIKVPNKVNCILSILLSKAFRGFFSFYFVVYAVVMQDKDSETYKSFREVCPKPIAAELIEEEGVNEWKRDFEEGDLLGTLRDVVSAARNRGDLPEGADVAVKNITYKSAPLQSSIHSIPSFFCHQFNVLEKLKDRIFPNPKKQRTILNNITFTLPKGTMTLVLGSPGSGKVCIDNNNFHQNIHIFIFSLLWVEF